MILYINNKHCTSVNELKEYFSMELTSDSDIYADLLDYGRHGDIAKWLREMGEPDIASSVDAIDTSLSDSAFYGQLKAAITGIDGNAGPQKPPFEKCFSFEGIKCDVKDNEAKIIVSLNVLMCVNEDYELSVSGNWGTRAELVNPYNHPEGKTASFTFTLRKRPDKDVGELTVKADGEVLSQSVVNSGEFLVSDVRFKMIPVEGGTFTMGATREQVYGANDNEKPTHDVTLSSYSIGETLVTQELWQVVMGNNPSIFKGAQRPVENVSWEDCQNFIQKLNQLTGKDFRLPTEAEWEYAARGGVKSKGYKYSGSNDIDEVAWYEANSCMVTHVVRTKMPNELGIYDMTGNVREWCQDWGGCYSSSSQTNPTGPASSDGRVLRSSSWMDEVRWCRVSFRCHCTPNFRCNICGLRLALSE